MDELLPVRMSNHHYLAGAAWDAFGWLWRHGHRYGNGNVGRYAWMRWIRRDSRALVSTAAAAIAPASHHPEFATAIRRRASCSAILRSTTTFSTSISVPVPTARVSVPTGIVVQLWISKLLSVPSCCLCLSIWDTVYAADHSGRVRSKCASAAVDAWPGPDAKSAASRSSSCANHPGASTGSSYYRCRYVNHFSHGNFDSS